MEETLGRHINEMKNMANILVPYSFPLVPLSEELIITPLKKHIVIIDGYEVVLIYNKSDFGDYYAESLQIESFYSPFLPFNLICKLGKKFLGEEHLSYTEIFRDGKKYYCWTVRTIDGKIIPPNEGAEVTTYEGFKYNIFNYK